MNRREPGERPSSLQVAHLSMLWLLYVAVSGWGLFLLLRRLIRWALL